MTWGAWGAPTVPNVRRHREWAHVRTCSLEHVPRVASISPGQPRPRAMTDRMLDVGPVSAPASTSERTMYRYWPLTVLQHNIALYELRTAGERGAKTVKSCIRYGTALPGAGQEPLCTSASAQGAQTLQHPYLASPDAIIIAASYIIT